MHVITKPPLKFFFWVLVSPSFTAYLAVEGMVLWGALFYGIFGITLLYWSISSKDCRIQLNSERLEVIFHRTFWKRKTFFVKDIDRIEFIKGDPAWKLFFIINKIERYYRSQDKLVLVSGDSHQEIMINTNSSDLKLLIDHFNKIRPYVLTDLLFNQSA
jgi:hypothetical protein